MLNKKNWIAVVLFLIIITSLILNIFYSFNLLNLIFNAILAIMLFLYIKNNSKSNVNSDELKNKIKSLEAEKTNLINEIANLKDQIQHIDLAPAMNTNTDDLEKLVLFNKSSQILDSFLESISERTLSETNTVIEQLNNFRNDHKSALNQTVNFLKTMLEDNKDYHSFKYIESLITKIKDVMLSIIKEMYDYQILEGNSLKNVESKISDIKVFTQKIKDIADSSHVLSFNASIEAAKSGGHAKGFGIIASQMKKLSDETKSTVSTIDKTTKETEIAVIQLKDQYNVVFDRLSHQAKSSEQELSSILESVSNSYRKILKETESISKNSQDSAQFYNNIIYIYSQSQDLLNQQLNHIKTVLSKLRTNLEETGSENKVNLKKIEEESLSLLYKSLTNQAEKDYIINFVKKEFQHINIDEYVKNKNIHIEDKTKEIIGEDTKSDIVLF